MTTVTVGREPGSDCTRFLRRLGTTLAFSGLLPHPAPTDTLRATFAVLGTHQTREEAPEVGSGFTSTPPGNWTCGKLFLADGEGEVFLNLNESEGLGEFSIKDEAYAKIVTTELAKIFLPVSGERPQ